MKAILVRPRFDDPTEHSFAFASEILEWCRDAGIETTELAEDEAMRTNVVRELSKGADLFIHYDHGNEDALIGQDEKAVIDLDNCSLLSNKETYTLACLSAKSLGVEVWHRGGKYWGYVEVVSYTTDALPEFQEAFNCGFHYRFIEGDSHQSALSRAKDTFSRLSLQLVDAGKTFAAICMRENGDNLAYYDGQKPEEKEGCLLTLLKLPKLVFSLKEAN